MAVVSSVGAALYKEFGLGDDDFGVLMAVKAIGAVVAGFSFARFMARAGQRLTYALTMGTHGALLFGIALWGDAYGTAMLMMFVLGLSFNAGRVLNTSLTATVSTPEQRGVFMAVVGIYWASGQLLGPLVFGPLAAVTTLGISISAAGAAMLAAGLLTPALYAACAPTLRPGEAGPAR